MKSPLLNLTFHGIGNQPRDLDPGEAKVWLSKESFCRHLDVAREEGDVVITFDDGNISDYEIALGALLERGLRAVFFVVAARIGEAGYLGKSEVMSLMEEGMEIGTHGMRHCPWRRLDSASLDVEIDGAKAAIEDLTGQAVRKAACPFGIYDRGVLRRLRRSGVETVYNSDKGRAYRDQWMQARNTLNVDDPADAIRRWSSAASGYQTLTRAAKRLVKSIR